MHTSSKIDTDVLIVGAGPTGLTMACELLRRGIDCRVVDKAEAPSKTSKALAVHARTLEIFDDMGVAEPLLERGVRLKGGTIYDGRHRLLHLRFQQVGTSYPYVLSVPQSDTEDVLIERLQSLGGTVERSSELTALRQRDHHVVATVNRVGRGASETIRARWLIGCDGAGSHVRKALGIAFAGSTYEQDFMLADVRIDWQKERDEGHIWFHKDGPLVALPFTHPHWRLIVNTPDEPAQEPTVERFQQLLSERTGETATIGDAIWLSDFKIHRRLVTRYRRGRVFLAGDAAHIHSPIGGQGMNIGIRDACNLAWKLALVIQSQAPASLLDTYEEERRPVAKTVLTGTHVATKLVTTRNPILRFVRNRLLTQLLSLGFTQPLVFKRVAGLDVNYRGGSLSEDRYGPWPATRRRADRDSEGPRLTDRWTFRWAPRAGDRAPDGSCLRYPSRSQTRLFREIKGTHGTLLLFGGRNPTEKGDAQLVRVADEFDTLLGRQIQAHIVVSGNDPSAALYGQDAILLDPEHELHRAYGAETASLYFIRPDGYIGFRSQPVDRASFHQYLSRRFGHNG